MLPIRKRIARPYLCIILMIPLAIIILFNVIVSFASKRQAEVDLQYAVQEISEALSTGSTQNLITLIRNQSHTTSAELVLFNRKGGVSKLFDLRATFITEDIAKQAYNAIVKQKPYEIGSFDYGGDTYYVVAIPYGENVLADQLVYISKGLVIDTFVETVNHVLVIVSLVITGVAILVSTRVTNAIAKPIEHLTKLVEHMQSDEVIYIDDRSDSIELQKLTQEINALNKRIYQYTMAQKNFLHNASHEIRTPLMSIQGYADGIEMGIFQDAKGTAYLISQQSKKLTKLVDSLLLLARVEQVNTDKKNVKYNLSEQLHELVQSYTGYAVREGKKLHSSIQSEVWIEATGELITGAIGNILSNAIRYASHNVEIQLTEIESNAVIEIKDDGKGIQDFEILFERFAKGEDGNCGLGLSIAKIAVEKMHGTMHVFNNNGAVFQVHIPKLYTDKNTTKKLE